MSKCIFVIALIRNVLFYKSLMHNITVIQHLNLNKFCRLFISAIPFSTLQFKYSFTQYFHTHIYVVTNILFVLECHADEIPYRTKCLQSKTYCKRMRCMQPFYGNIMCESDEIMYWFRAIFI